MRGVVLTVASLLLFAGCASVPLATPEQDGEAKGFIPKADVARLYIYRNPQLAGASAICPITVNGRSVGSLKNGTFVVEDVGPGFSQITVSLGSSENQASVSCAVGQICFVSTGFVGHGIGPPEMVQVSTEVGQSDVQRLDLIKTQ